MDIRPFSMTADRDIPVFYVDAAAINAGINERKKPLALELLNMITGGEFMARVSANGGSPRYLFSARCSVYDALSPEYPVYARLKEIAMLPDARVFRMKPDGTSYMEQAKKRADVLPAFFASNPGGR